MEAIGAIVILEILIMLGFMLFAFLSLGFWLWMLIDCVKYEKEDNERLIWILIIILVGPIGAFIYFLMRKNKNRKVSPSD